MSNISFTLQTKSAFNVQTIVDSVLYRIDKKRVDELSTAIPVSYTHLGQDIREYVGGRIFGGRIDMHCRSYPGIGHLVCVQEASGTVHALSLIHIFCGEIPAHLPRGVPFRTRT